MLYSMKTSDGHKLMNQTALEAWLMDLIQKNKAIVRRQFVNFVNTCLQYPLHEYTKSSVVSTSTTKLFTILGVLGMAIATC